MTLPKQDPKKTRFDLVSIGQWVSGGVVIAAICAAVWIVISGVKW